MRDWQYPSGNHLPRTGGHSWGDFWDTQCDPCAGQCHSQDRPAQSDAVPETTYNVGSITGGESVNTIASRATMLVDLRSVQPQALQQLEARVTRVLQEIAQQSGIQVTSRIVGQRPAAALDTQHALCQGCRRLGSNFASGQQYSRPLAPMPISPSASGSRPCVLASPEVTWPIRCRNILTSRRFRVASSNCS